METKVRSSLPILRDFSRNVKWDSVANEESVGRSTTIIMGRIERPWPLFDLFELLET